MAGSRILLIPNISILDGLEEFKNSFVNNLNILSNKADKIFLLPLPFNVSTIRTFLSYTLHYIRLSNMNTANMHTSYRGNVWYKHLFTADAGSSLVRIPL